MKLSFQDIVYQVIKVANLRIVHILMQQVSYLLLYTLYVYVYIILYMYMYIYPHMHVHSHSNTCYCPQILIVSGISCAASCLFHLFVPSHLLCFAMVRMWGDHCGKHACVVH